MASNTPVQFYMCSPDEVAGIQNMLDETWKTVGTRDRKRLARIGGSA